MIVCGFVLDLAGVKFPCQLEFGHWGKCKHSLSSVDADINWIPSDQDRSDAMRKIVEAAKAKQTEGKKL